MPKKQRNAFYFFMKEHQDLYIGLGKRVSLKEIADECHPLYKNLTAKEKEKYEQMAKDYKNQVRDTLEGKLCSDGTVLALNIEAEREKWEAMENETKAIERMVFEMNSVDEVADRSFYIVCFNVLCCTDEEEYIPNEVGIAKYSLRRGIEEHYHCFINPGSIPLGYTGSSKKHSEETHLIPISGHEHADSDYKSICKNIFEFVNPEHKTIAPVFCREENLAQNRGCINWLSDKVHTSHMESIHFYDITCLLMELRAYVNKAFPSRAVAMDFLSNHAFDYVSNTRCNYHEENDNAFCALGCAKRACFIFSDVLCNLYGIDCTSDHLPPRVGDAIENLEVEQSAAPVPMVFTPPKLPQKHVLPRTEPKSYSSLISNAEKIQNSSNGQPWIFKEFCQPQQDIVHSKNILSSSSIEKTTSRLGEMRQPSTTPLVLNVRALQVNPQFENLCRGRGIGRGKQAP